MNMHKYIEDNCYFYSSLTGQILAFEWLMTWMSWIVIRLLNYDQADNTVKQQS